ncbi:hypothetical protein FACS1894211_05150 [Clostridia bacterium]|nr:hypothetical protein FACS1894211_05150 [Clostridia bacterium]
MIIIMEMYLIIDLVIVALIVIGALIGLMRGFFKTLLSFFGVLVSMLISIWLASYLAAALMPVSFVAKIFGGDGSLTLIISASVEKINPGIFGVPANQLTGTLAAALTESMKLPQAIADIIVSAANGLNLMQSELPLSLIIGQALSGAILWLVCAFLLFLVLRIVMHLLKKFFKFLTKNKHIRKVDRFFGFLLGAVKGFLTVIILFGLMSFVIGMDFMKDFKANLDQTTIGRPVSDTIFKWVGDRINLEKLLGEALKDKIGKVSLTNGEAQNVLIELQKPDFDAHPASDFSGISIPVLNQNLNELYETETKLHNAICGVISLGVGNATIKEDYDAKLNAAEEITAKYAELYDKLGQYRTAESGFPEGIAQEARDLVLVPLAAEMSGILNDIGGLYQNHFVSLLDGVAN